MRFVLLDSTGINRKPINKIAFNARFFLFSLPGDLRGGNLQCLVWFPTKLHAFRRLMLFSCEPFFKGILQVDGKIFIRVLWNCFGNHGYCENTTGRFHEKATMEIGAY